MIPSFSPWRVKVYTVPIPNVEALYVNKILDAS